MKLLFDNNIQIYQESELKILHVLGDKFYFIAYFIRAASCQKSSWCMWIQTYK